MKRYSVLLVEDDANTRNKLANAISDNPDFDLIAAAECCQSARDELNNKAPDVLLTDLGLPDGSGLEIIKETNEKYPDTEIMVITVFGDEKNVLSAIEAGATGYLLKDTDLQGIGEAILELIAGNSPISPSIARHLLKRFKTEAIREKSQQQDMPILTRREKEVLTYVVKGFSYSEIANLINVSIHTVTSHVKHIYKKLSVRSRGEAVFEAMQLGIVKLDE
jgi:DNA-binding NarL/FixJ family response regulator